MGPWKLITIILIGIGFKIAGMTLLYIIESNFNSIFAYVGSSMILAGIGIIIYGLLMYGRQQSQ